MDIVQATALCCLYTSGYSVWFDRVCHIFYIYLVLHHLYIIVFRQNPSPPKNRHNISISINFEEHNFQQKNKRLAFPKSDIHPVEVWLQG